MRSPMISASDMKVTTKMPIRLRRPERRSRSSTSGSCFRGSSRSAAVTTSGYLLHLPGLTLN